MIYLEQEVDHLEDANIYLLNDEKSNIAIDLLLGTQGWRRYAFVDLDKFIEENKSQTIAPLENLGIFQTTP